jgi:chromosome segregation ATPase
MTMALKRFWKYTVEGRWPFPVDMLRRDRAVGASPEDAQAIIDLSAEFMPEEKADRKAIICILSEERPTKARWKSFNWTVSERIDSVEVERATTDAEKLELIARLKQERQYLVEFKQHADDKQKEADRLSNELADLRRRLPVLEEKADGANYLAKDAYKEVKEQEAIVEKLIEQLTADD